MSSFVWKDVLEEGEELLYECPCEGSYTRCRGGDEEKDEKRGRLCVTSRRMLLHVDGTEGVTEVLSSMIFLNAISRDASEPKPCVYCQCNSSGEDDEDDYDEVRFAPDDAACLDDLHQSICKSVALNPGPDDEDEDDDEEDEDGMMGHPAPCLPKLSFVDALTDDTKEIGGFPSELPAKVSKRDDDHDDK